MKIDTKKVCGSTVFSNSFENMCGSEEELVGETLPSNSVLCSSSGGVLMFVIVFKFLYCCQSRDICPTVV